MENLQSLTDVYGPVISTYTRAQALADGCLVDVSEMAREAGFKIPVAVTAGVWSEVVTPPAGTEKIGQSWEGRLWDIFSVLSYMIRSGRGASQDGQRIDFSIMAITRLPKKNREPRPELVPMYALCGPGDHLEPVVTIMLPNED